MKASSPSPVRNSMSPGSTNPSTSRILFSTPKKLRDSLTSQHEIFKIQSPNLPNDKNRWEFAKSVERQEIGTINENKSKIAELIEKLDKIGILVGETFDDFKILEAPIENNEGTRIYKVRELFSDTKNGLLSPRSLNTLHFNDPKVCKALKRIEIDLSKKSLSPFWKEIEILTSQAFISTDSHILPIERVFFEKINENEENSQTSPIIQLNIVFPWTSNSLISWLVGGKGKRYKNYLEISRNKRSFDEVREVIISILKGIQFLHERNYIHGDLSFDNILINEYRDESLNSIRETLIGGFRIVKNLMKLKLRMIENPDFFAPEIMKHQKLLFSETSVEYYNDQQLHNLFFGIEASQTPSKQIREGSDGAFTFASDIYAFGVLLYKLFIESADGVDLEFLTKEIVISQFSKLFFHNPGLIKQKNELLEEILEILKVTLDKDPKNRKTATELLKGFKFFDPDHKFEINNDDNSKTNDTEMSMEKETAEDTKIEKFFDDNFKRIDKNFRSFQKMSPEMQSKPSDILHSPRSKVFNSSLLTETIGSESPRHKTTESPPQSPGKLRHSIVSSSSSSTCESTSKPSPSKQRNLIPSMSTSGIENKSKPSPMKQRNSISTILSSTMGGKTKASPSKQRSLIPPMTTPNKTIPTTPRSSIASASSSTSSKNQSNLTPRNCITSRKTENSRIQEFKNKEINVEQKITPKKPIETEILPGTPRSIQTYLKECQKISKQPIYSTKHQKTQRIGVKPIQKQQPKFFASTLSSIDKKLVKPINIKSISDSPKQHVVENSPLKQKNIEILNEKDPEVLFRLAMKYLFGESPEHQKKSKKLAKQLLEKLASFSFYSSIGKYFLGYMTCEGFGGLEKDEKTGFQMMNDSATLAAPFFEKFAAPFSGSPNPGPEDEKNKKILELLAGFVVPVDKLAQIQQILLQNGVAAAKIPNNSEIKSNIPSTTEQNENNFNCKYCQWALGQIHWKVKKNPEKAISYFKKSANDGNFYLSQYYLGLIYLNEEKFRDYDNAFKFFEKAAKQNHAESQNYVGFLLQNGIGTKDGKPDFAESFIKFKESAAQGCNLARNNLGGIFYNGSHHIKRNFAKAFEFFKLSADEGNDPDAQNQVGWMLQNGEGCKKNLEKALYYYKLSSGHKNFNALKNLGLFLHFFFPFNKKKNSNFIHINRSGWFYQNGFGLPDNKKDYVKAIECYYSAATEGNNSEAAFNLGWIYENCTDKSIMIGKSQKKEKLEISIEWYEKAASLGETDSHEAISRVKQQLQQLKKTQANHIDD